MKNTVESDKIGYKGIFKQLVKKIARLTAQKKVRGPDKRKNFKDYGKQH